MQVCEPLTHSADAAEVTDEPASERAVAETTTRLDDDSRDDRHGLADRPACRRPVAIRGLSEDTTPPPASSTTPAPSTS